jgi:hypothetical protein
VDNVKKIYRWIESIVEFSGTEKVGKAGILTSKSLLSILYSIRIYKEVFSQFITTKLSAWLWREAIE